MTRVLVIDDDIGTAELMRVVLDDAGFDVTVAMTTRDIPTQKFDCIVSDLMSVQVYTYEDARDWLLRLADRFPGIPVIVVTAHLEARRDQAALGARRVIMKPFDVDLIPAAVREATAR